MMDTPTNNPDRLGELFSQLPEEELPASFRLDVMQQVAREAAKAQRRSERWGLAAVITASLVLLGMTAYLIHYYIGFPEDTGRNIQWPKIDSGLFSFYSYIGLLALLLLWLDYRLRKVFRKRQS